MNAVDRLDQVVCRGILEQKAQRSRTRTLKDIVFAAKSGRTPNCLRSLGAVGG
jgi:hypothetical protein